MKWLIRKVVGLRLRDDGYVDVRGIGRCSLDVLKPWCRWAVEEVERG